MCASYMGVGEASPELMRRVATGIFGRAPRYDSNTTTSQQQGNGDGENVSAVNDGATVANKRRIIRGLPGTVTGAGNSYTPGRQKSALGM